MALANFPRQIVLIDANKDSRDLAAALFEESGLDVVGYDDWIQALGYLETRSDQVALVFGDLDGDPAGSVAAGRIADRWPKVHLVLTGSQGRPSPDAARYMQKPWLALDVLMAAEQAAVFRA